MNVRTRLSLAALLFCAIGCAPLSAQEPAPGWVAEGTAAAEKLAATRLIGVLKVTTAQALELTEALERASDRSQAQEQAEAEALARFRSAGEAARKRALRGETEAGPDETAFAAAQKSSAQQRQRARQETIAGLKSSLERLLTPAQWAEVRKLADFPLAAAAPTIGAATGGGGGRAGGGGWATRLLDLTRKQSLEEWEKARKNMEQRIAGPAGGEALRPALRERLVQRLALLSRARQMTPEEYAAQRAAMAAELTEQRRAESRAEHPLSESDPALFLARELLRPATLPLLRARAGLPPRRDGENTAAPPAFADAAAARTAFAEARVLRALNGFTVTDDQARVLVRLTGEWSRNEADWDRGAEREGRGIAAALASALPRLAADPRLKIPAESEWQSLMRSRAAQSAGIRSRSQAQLVEYLRGSLAPEQVARLLALAREAAVQERMENPGPETRAAVSEALHELEQLRNQPAAAYVESRERLAPRWAKSWGAAAAPSGEPVPVPAAAVAQQRQFLDRVHAMSPAEWSAQESAIAAQLTRTRAARWAAGATLDELLPLFADRCLLQPDAPAALQARLSR